MKTCMATPSWGGSPFAAEIDRALWELGYPNDFDTEVEARAAVAELLQHRPDLAANVFDFVEVQ